MSQKAVLNNQKNDRRYRSGKLATMNDCHKVLFQKKLMSLNECIKYLQRLKRNDEKI